MSFERLGVFTFSRQEGTRAAELDDDVPDEVKRARQEELTELQRGISEDRLSRYIGRETTVLVDELVGAPSPIRNPGCAIDPTHVGRVPWQADDVDGVTFVAQGGWARPGEFVRVRVAECEDYDFRAVALA